MTIVQDRYQELLSLTQLYLLRHHALKDSCVVSPLSYRFLKKESSRALAKTRESPVIPLSPFYATTTPPSIQPSPDPQIPGPGPVPSPRPPQPDPLPPTNPPERPSPDPTPPIITRTAQNKMFQLETLGAAKFSFDDTMHATMQTLFPHVQWLTQTPNDRLARKKREEWTTHQQIPPVVILSFEDHEGHLTFLKNIAHAISLRLAPARVIAADHFEKTGQWDQLVKSPQLRLVIASDYGIYLKPGLKPYYREVPQQGKHFLHETPLLLLSDLSLYLQQPQLKSLLWRAICNEFALSQPVTSKYL